MLRLLRTLNVNVVSFSGDVTKAKAFKLLRRITFKSLKLCFYPLLLSRGQEKLPRSSSIDSMVDMVWNNESDTNLVTLPKHLVVQEATNRRESMLSPRRTKQSRGINCKHRCRHNIYVNNVKRKCQDYPCCENISDNILLTKVQGEYQRGETINWTFMLFNIIFPKKAQHEREGVPRILNIFS